MSKQKVFKWNTNHAAPTYINMPYVYSVAKYLAEYFQPTASYGGKKILEKQVYGSIENVTRQQLELK